MISEITITFGFYFLRFKGIMTYAEAEHKVS